MIGHSLRIKATYGWLRSIVKIDNIITVDNNNINRGEINMKKKELKSMLNASQSQVAKLTYDLNQAKLELRLDRRLDVLEKSTKIFGCS